jgi:uncharacterized protein
MNALQRAIADACLSATAHDELASDPRAFLVRHGVEPDDVEAIVAAPARLSVYRSLVRNGLSSIVLSVLPRTRARMNAACRGRFDADLAAFVDTQGPRTHYLRDVPAELFAWAEPRWRSDARVPPYLVDLAAHELLHVEVAAAPSSGGGVPHPARGPGGDEAADAGEIALDRPLAFAGSARIARYGWAVHELPADPNATDEPARRDVCLLAYRDATQTVRWLDLTPLAGAIVVRLLSGEALGSAVARACADHATAPSQVLPEIARLLADLGDRGALRGGAR